MAIDRNSLKKYILPGILGVLILIAAGVTEFSESLISENGELERNPAGGAQQEIDLILNAEGLPKDYSYHLTLEPEQVNEEMALNYFQEAIQEIEETFYAEEENADYVTEPVTMKENYADGLVTAEWMLDDYTYVSPEGVINADELTENGSLVTAQAMLTCGDYSQLYEFSFAVYPPALSHQKALLKKIDEAVVNSMSEKGKIVFQLPDSVDGVLLSWREKKSFLTLKVLFLEILVFLLLKIARAEEEQEKIKKRREIMEMEYSELVSKLSILMGSGMTLKSAWEQIVSRYLNDQKKHKLPEKPSYEEMAITLRAIKDGESERTAYRKFGERCNVPCYYKLSRLLLQNLEKGNKKLCGLLEKEAEESFEERKFYARKKGEEAGTRMLMPLMLMMVIVIAIVIVPAIVSFNV